MIVIDSPKNEKKQNSAYRYMQKTHHENGGFFVFAIYTATKKAKF